MKFAARIFDRVTGALVLTVHIGADSLRDAEERVIAIACFHLRSSPKTLEARHIHQMTPAS